MDSRPRRGILAPGLREEVMPLATTRRAAHGWNSEPIGEPASYTSDYAPRVLRFLQSRL